MEIPFECFHIKLLLSRYRQDQPDPTSPVITERLLFMEAQSYPRKWASVCVARWILYAIILLWYRKSNRQTSSYIFNLSKIRDFLDRFLRAIKSSIEYKRDITFIFTQIKVQS